MDSFLDQHLAGGPPRSIFQFQAETEKTVLADVWTVEGHHLAYMLSKKYKKVFKMKTPETGLYQGVNACWVTTTTIS